MWFSFGSYQGSVVSGFGSISEFISAEGRFLLRKIASCNVPLFLRLIEFVVFFFSFFVFENVMKVLEVCNN